MSERASAAEATNNLDTVWGALGTHSFQLKMVEAGGWTTRVLTAGDGPPLILMHGTGGHLEAFARNVPALSADFRVVAYDFPAHGYSSLADRDVEISDYEAHLLALLDTLEIDRANLMGESLGGWVAAKFAAHHPDRVDRVILNTPGGRTANLEVMNRIHTLTYEAVEDPTPERVRTRLEWLMADPSSVTDELVEIRRAIYARPGFLESIYHVLCLVREEPRLRNLITDDELREVSAETLVLWTSDDPSAPESVGREMEALLPRGSFAFIEAAGHWPQWEQPEIYNRTALEFLLGPRQDPV